MLDFKCCRNQGFRRPTIGATIFELTADLLFKVGGNVQAHAASDRLRY
jgi:hypothetical protein